MKFVAIKGLFAGTFAVSGMVGLSGHAEASPSQTATVDGVDYPVCQQEDCSDQPGQVGLWQDQDTGTWWLSLGEVSYIVRES